MVCSSDERGCYKITNMPVNVEKFLVFSVSHATGFHFDYNDASELDVRFLGGQGVP